MREAISADEGGNPHLPRNRRALLPPQVDHRAIGQPCGRDFPHHIILRGLEDIPSVVEQQRTHGVLVGAAATS
jgi:hypothetical protein